MHVYDAAGKLLKTTPLAELIKSVGLDTAANFPFNWTVNTFTWDGSGGA